MSSHAHTDNEIDDEGSSVEVDMDIAFPISNKRKSGEGYSPASKGSLAKSDKNRKINSDQYKMQIQLMNLLFYLMV